MSSPLHIVRDFLEESEGDAPELHGPNRPRTATKAQAERSRQRLDDTRRLNSRLLVIPLLAVCALLVLGIFFAIYHRDKPATLAGVLGATSISFPLLILTLRRLWHDKWVSDLLLTAAEGLTPAEFADLAAKVYFAHRKESAPDFTFVQSAPGGTK